MILNTVFNGLEMTTTECLMIFSTLLSPLIAVQITRRLDDRKDNKSRKINIFKTLMSTRAYGLSTAHVEALNSIDLEFSGNNFFEKDVIDCWKQYLDILSNTQLTPEQWSDKRTDGLVGLLKAMSYALDYDFDKTHIKNSFYSPVAHGKIENDQEKLRIYLLDLLDGKRTLPVKIFEADL